MSDMSAIIVPKSDQINADDLTGGRTVTVTVTKVSIRGGQEQPISIHLAETDKVYRPCKSMCRVLAQAWGLDSALYAGRSMTLYTDPSVKFGPLAVGGIRISHMSHIDGPLVMALTATKGVKKSYKVLPLEAAKPREQQIDKAAEGVRTLVARIGSVDPKNLQGLIDDPVVVKQRAWLAANRPGLAAQVNEAVAAKSVSEIDNDDPFGLPPLGDAADKRDDDEMGEGFTGADVSSHATTATRIAQRFYDAKDADEIGQILEEEGEVMQAMDDASRAHAMKARHEALTALKGGK